jgi:hypothetical protein
VAWLSYSPSIVAIAAVDTVIVLDFCVSNTKPIHSFPIDGAVRVAWNDINPGTLIVGCADGKVLIYAWSDGSFGRKPGANRLLSQWEAQTKTVLSRE